jgi:hypothetical protein
MFCLGRDTFLYSFTYAGGQLLIGILLGEICRVLIAQLVALLRTR